MLTEEILLEAVTIVKSKWNKNTQKRKTQAEQILH